MKIQPFLKRFDLLVQSGLLCISPYMALRNHVIPDIMHEDYLFGLVMTAIFLGVWQMASSALSIVTTNALRREKLRHFKLATAYLVITFLTENFVRYLPDTFQLIAVGVAMTVPAVLAIYYYVITWKWVLGRDSQTGNFLPHTSF